MAPTDGIRPSVGASSLIKHGYQGRPPPRTAGGTQTAVVLRGPQVQMAASCCYQRFRHPETRGPAGRLRNPTWSIGTCQTPQLGASRSRQRTSGRLATSWIVSAPLGYLTIHYHRNPPRAAPGVTSPVPQSSMPPCPNGGPGDCANDPLYRCRLRNRQDGGRRCGPLLAVISSRVSGWGWGEQGRRIMERGGAGAGRTGRIGTGRRRRRFGRCLCP
jgi:hypothetical protein